MHGAYMLVPAEQNHNNADECPLMRSARDLKWAVKTWKHFQHDVKMKPEDERYKALSHHQLQRIFVNMADILTYLKENAATPEEVAEFEKFKACLMS